MPGVQNHVGDAAPVGTIAGSYYFTVFQIASYHRFVLSWDSSFKKLKFSEPKAEIPNQVRDDKTQKQTLLSC
jgi:hypothetical protein